ncbi:MAG: hypothetical protein M0P43_01195 [Arcobacteraceae bacterium]|jgi:hypothetical protein|nr:hypothetical protein [Arcobacteraceae bacterium]MDY0327101.1 hypothetical protein [Arcobacteraceae bacterium]
MKFFVLLILLISNIYGQNVLTAKSNISFKDILTKEHFNVVFINPSEIPRTCELVSIDDIETNKYFASKYIRAGSVICKKDLQVYESNSVVFDFGILEIKTDGEIIHETDEYITIKKHDGSVHKIYKDGRDR